MTKKDIEKFKNKFVVGDIVVIPKELAHLTHVEDKEQLAEVVGFYRNFFNVKYLDESLRYEQSIQYKDAGSVRKLVNKIA